MARNSDDISGQSHAEYKIYKHTTPDGKSYIGVTSTSLEYRWKNGRNYQYNKAFQDAINQYGWDQIKHEVIDIALGKDDAYTKELHYIAKYNSTNPAFGYNESPGGGQMSQRTKEKISRSLSKNTGEKSPRSRPVLMIEPNTMRVVRRFVSARDAAQSIQTKSISAISNACRQRIGDRITPCSHGYFWSYEDEYDPEYFQQFKGIKILESGRLPRTGSRKPVRDFFTEEDRTLAVQTHERPVRCVETGRVYRSIREAADSVGCSPSAIGKQIRGKIIKVKGCHWEYADTKDVITVGKN